MSTQRRGFYKRVNIATLNGSSLKQLDKFTYLGSSVSTTEADINTQVAKTLILLYGCTTWTLTKYMKKRLNCNCTRMLRAILNKYRRQHPTKQQLYGYPPPITKTIQARRTRHAGHCWRSKYEHTGDVLLWNPSHGRAKAGRLDRTYIQQLCANTGCSLEDLPGAKDDRDGWWERVREIRTGRATWGGWWWIRIKILMWTKVISVY